MIFGITGDLAQKMTFRSLYRLEQHRLLDFPILGVARGTMPTDELVKRAREAIINSGEHPDEAVAAMPERGKAPDPSLRSGCVIGSVISQCGWSPRGLRTAARVARV